MSSIPLHGYHWSASALLRRHSSTDAGKHSALFVPSLDEHERVLYRTKAGATTTVVGTEHAVHFRTGDSAWRRIAWCDVVAAGRYEADGATMLRMWPGAAESVVTIAADAYFAEFVAERIAYVRVFSQRVHVTPRVGGVVEAVRVAHSETLTWRVHLDVPTYGDNPLVARECDRLVLELRSLVGC